MKRIAISLLLLPFLTIGCGSDGSSSTTDSDELISDSEVVAVDIDDESSDSDSVATGKDDSGDKNDGTKEDEKTDDNKDDSEPSPCKDVTCSGHGTCIVENDAAKCNCQSGFHAEALECVEDETANPCKDVTCSGHGACVVENNAAKCDCNDGFHAEVLECVQDEVDLCAGKTCSNHGTCEPATGNCNCNEGWEGDNCETAKVVAPSWDFSIYSEDGATELDSFTLDKIACTNMQGTFQVFMSNSTDKANLLIRFNASTLEERDYDVSGDGLDVMFHASKGLQYLVKGKNHTAGDAVLTVTKKSGLSGYEATLDIGTSILWNNNVADATLTPSSFSFTCK